jgi:hypothetical protein
MAGRTGASILIAFLLLLPRVLLAEAAPAGEKKPVTREELEKLEERIEELETDKIAHEDATRSIIRQTFSEWGAKINEYVTLGGTFEVLAGWNEDFTDQDESTIQLSTTQVDFEIQVNDWSLGSIIFEYDDGADVLFPTSDGGEASVDRLNIDTAFLTLGNTERFWLFGTFGRMIVPFGISTGDPVADVLTINDPLTVEAFETKEDAVLVGVAFPTPPLTRPPQATMTPPPVRPLLLNPLFSRLSRLLGYKPLPIPALAPVPLPPPPAPPPFNAGVYVYNGTTHDNSADREWRRPLKHMGGTVGYRTKGDCPRSFCPWTLDMDVDFSGSLFESRFLSFEYKPFFSQIRYVPGIAAHVKTSIGPVALVGEWNGAIEKNTITDDFGNTTNLKPSAWQLSLNYQFDWNPWVEAIGSQGTYLALGYSQSRDLAGILQDVDGRATRVGFVPRQRILAGVGEWVLEGLRVAVEYSHVIDYSKDKRGTGNSASGVFALLTYQW